MRFAIASAIAGRVRAFSAVKAACTCFFVNRRTLTPCRVASFSTDRKSERIRNPRFVRMVVSSITSVAGRYSPRSFLIARIERTFFSDPRISFTPQSKG